jgi:hypothetical protein
LAHRKSAKRAGRAVAPAAAVRTAPITSKQRNRSPDRLIPRCSIVSPVDSYSACLERSSRVGREARGTHPTASRPRRYYKPLEPQQREQTRAHALRSSTSRVLVGCSVRPADAVHSSPRSRLRSDRMSGEHSAARCKQYDPREFVLASADCAGTCAISTSGLTAFRLMAKVFPHPLTNGWRG